MGALRSIFWVLTMLGAVIGGGFLLSSFAASGAPQQAAAAAIGIGFAVLPYCFTRALSELVDDSWVPGLIPCRACHKAVALDAPTCSHSGAPAPRGRTPEAAKNPEVMCRHCHRPIATAATVCPHCGTPGPHPPQPSLLLGPR